MQNQKIKQIEFLLYMCSQCPISVHQKVRKMKCFVAQFFLIIRCSLIPFKDTDMQRLQVFHKLSERMTWHDKFQAVFLT